MRKQYNFWPSSDGLDAWDVDRLIEMSRKLPVKEIELSSIREIDTPYWSQPLTVRQVAERARLVCDVDPSYPIILAVDGRVMDGMHRVVRALLEGTADRMIFRTRPVPSISAFASSNAGSMSARGINLVRWRPDRWLP